jgi:Spy/CpxP family protein refolding chaperone
MTPAQKDATRTAFEQARRDAQPIEQELRNNQQSLQSAVRSDDSAEIQRLASAEGHEIGQLLAIRSDAAAKVYKTLTPDQKTKADALQQLIMREMQQGRMGQRARVSS